MEWADNTAAIKSVIKQSAQALWPIAEAAAEFSNRFGSDRKGLKIFWADQWNDTLDQALQFLPPPQYVTRDQYRALVQPTEHAKVHALVMERDEPLALISLRRRKRMWEPVSFRSLPGFIAPARNLSALGRSLRALGLNIQVHGGLEATIFEAKPTTCQRYDVVRVSLQESYEEYWQKNKGKHRKHIVSARKKCKRMHLVVNQPSDIDWIVSTWSKVWRGSPNNEIVAPSDRIAFWKTLPSMSENPHKLTLQVYALYDDDRPVAGTITTALGRKQISQCLVQRQEYRKFGAGTHVLDRSLQHGATKGFELCDLGGGHGYKSLWGPNCGYRYSATFRPKVFNQLERAHLG